MERESWDDETLPYGSDFLTVVPSCLQSTAEETKCPFGLIA